MNSPGRREIVIPAGDVRGGHIEHFRRLHKKHQSDFASKEAMAW